MAAWKSPDEANSAPLQKLNLRGTVRTARDQYGNTTTVGVFAADAAEVAANPNVAHAGWQLRTAYGSRERFETLVAMRITSDGADDTTLPDA